MYECKCGDDGKNRRKGISKSYSKNIKFAEYKNCLDGEKYQEERENYILGSVNHEMYLQKMKKKFIFFSMIRGFFKVIVMVFL